MLRSSQYIVTVIGLLLVFVSSCAQDHKNKGYEIVSLSPAMTEMLFSLGAGNKIAGVTTFCNFPEETKNITKVGDFSNPSIERIVALRPDLVIVNLPEQGRIKRELDKLKIKTFVSSPTSLSEIYDELAALGQEIGMQRAADSLISYMKDNLKQTTPVERKKVYIEISPRPLITVGSRAFLNDLIHDAGGINIFADLDKDYPVVTQESVIARNPEIIIVLHPEGITGRTGWQNIEAIQRRQLYEGLDPDHFMRPGPRLIYGFRELSEIIND